MKRLPRPTVMPSPLRLLAAATLFTAALACARTATALTPAELPRPANGKQLFADQNSAIYMYDASVEATVDAYNKAFAEKGWIPYGIAGDIRFFKLGKTRATALISASPVDKGKTAVNLSSETISADLPVPPDAVEVQYSDRSRQLTFRSSQSPDQVAEYYRTALGATGWTTKMAKPEKVDFKYVIIFRSPNKEKIEIEMTAADPPSLATVTYQTREDVEAEEARAAKQGDAIKKKLADAAAAPKPKLALTLPAETIAKAPSSEGFKISLPAKKAKAAVESLQKQFEAAGWTVDYGPRGNEAGGASFSLDNQSVTIVYMDPGFMPAEVTLKITGVEITAEVPAKK